MEILNDRSLYSLKCGCKSKEGIIVEVDVDVRLRSGYSNIEIVLNVVEVNVVDN